MPSIEERVAQLEKLQSIHNGQQQELNTSLYPHRNTYSADKLRTARNINGTPFDGTQDITISSSSPVTTLLGYLPLASAKFTYGVGTNLATGNNNLYTCPTSKRAFVTQAAITYNNSGVGNIVCTPYVQFGGAGTRYRITTDFTILNATGGTNGQGGIVLEAGDILGITTTTNNGLNIMWSIIEYPATIKVYSSIKKDPASGNNTIYTCPASTVAIILSGATFSGSDLILINGTGGGLDFYWNIVPSGGSVGTGNQFVNPVTLAANNSRRSLMSQSITLASGDFINTNWSGANSGGLTYVTVFEIAA